MFLAGCGLQSFRKDQQVEDAILEAQNGDVSAAINKLENLQDAHPDDPFVAEGLGIVYGLRGNYLLASNYFQKAARLSPEKRNLLLNSAEYLLRAEQPENAANRIDNYLRHFPDDVETWIQLANLRFDLEEHDLAISAFERGFSLSSNPAELTAERLRLAELYVKAKNFSQADYHLNWILNNAESDEQTATALLGLIRSSVEQRDWEVADVFLKRYDGTIADESKEDISVLRVAIAGGKDAIDSLATTQDEIQEAENQNTDEIADVEEPLVEAEEVAEVMDQEAIEDTPLEVVEPEIAEEVMEPADEADTEIASLDIPASIDEEAQEPEIADSAVIEELEETEEVIAITEDQEEAIENMDTVEEIPVEYQEILPEDAVDALIANARQSIREDDYASAIRFSWDAVNLERENPLAWFYLSYAYAGFGQFLNAETAALEAMRLNPHNRLIAMHYLSVIQRSQNASRFHEETLNLYRKFPREPQLILALARSYARIKNDPENAHALYRKFLELTPDSELAAQVREEIAFVE